MNCSKIMVREVDFELGLSNEESGIAGEGFTTAILI